MLSRALLLRAMVPLVPTKAPDLTQVSYDEAVGLEFAGIRF